MNKNPSKVYGVKRFAKMGVDEQFEPSYGINLSVEVKKDGMNESATTFNSQAQNKKNYELVKGGKSYTENPEFKGNTLTRSQFESQSRSGISRLKI